MKYQNVEGYQSMPMKIVVLAFGDEVVDVLWHNPFLSLVQPSSVHPLMVVTVGGWNIGQCFNIFLFIFFIFWPWGAGILDNV